MSVKKYECEKRLYLVTDRNKFPREIVPEIIGGIKEEGTRIKEIQNGEIMVA